MIRFFLGATFGCIATLGFVAFGPSDTPRKVRATGQVIAQKASETKFEICERDFLDETHCYQDLRRTADECVKLIKKKCS